MIENDQQFEEATIKSVDREGDNCIYLRFESGSFLLVRNDRDAQLPKPGEVARLYGKGLGYPVRGVAVGDRVYHYQTEEEYKAESQASVEGRLNKKRREWLQESEKRIDALPPSFQDRMKGFLERKKDFGPKFGLYELMVCEQAFAMAKHFGSTRKLKDFSEMTYIRQREVFPMLAEGHSGNSFAMSIRLAYLYLTDQNSVVREHGALCPLVGCEEYGCRVGK